MISEVDKRELKTCFASWLDCKDRKKVITSEEKDLKQAVGRILDVKESRVGKMFSFLKARTEKGEDELGELVEMVSQLEE